MKINGFSVNSRFFDLNSELFRGHTFASLRKEMADEFRETHFYSTDGLSSCLRISKVRQALSWSLQGPKLFLLASISLPSLRPTDLSGKLARHRSLSARRQDQALSLGISRPGLPQHLGQRQCGPRLAHLRRFRAGVDRYRAQAFRPRGLRLGTPTDRLRSRFHHHRSLPGALSLGQISPTQRRGETAYA